MLPTEVQFFKHFANPLLRKILHGNLNKSVQWVPDEFLKFEVHVRKYSYDVYMQDLLLWRHVPRPNDWWMHEQMHELTTLTIGVSLRRNSRPTSGGQANLVASTFYKKINIKFSSMLNIFMKDFDLQISIFLSLLT